MKDFLKTHKKQIAIIVLILVLVLCIYGTVSIVIQVRHAKTVVAECVSNIQNHGITEAHLSMHFPPLNVAYTDEEEILTLLDTLEGASYTPTIRIGVSHNSNMLHVNTNGHDYYIGQSGSVFKISKDGQRYFYFCSNNQAFTIKFLELIKPYEEDPSYYLN